MLYVNVTIVCKGDDFKFVCPGSDVNSMDSVDSGCTMGAGESQSNHTASSNCELIIWEIEVPKVSENK